MLKLGTSPGRAFLEEGIVYARDRQEAAWPVPETDRDTVWLGFRVWLEEQERRGTLVQ